MMYRYSCGLVAAGAILAACSNALAGPEWIEGTGGTGDAGSTAGTAQVISTSGPLTRLQGILNGVTSVAGPGDFEDVYQIVITQPLSFLINFSDSPLDFSLFLFNVNGIGLLGNLDGTAGPFGGPVLPNHATESPFFTLVSPGIFYLAISGDGNLPRSAGGDIFSFTVPFEVSGADGPGAGLPLSSWSGPGVIGAYDITMISGGIIPAPGAATVLVLAGFLGRRRR